MKAAAGAVRTATANCVPVLMRPPCPDASTPRPASVMLAGQGPQALSTSAVSGQSLFFPQRDSHCTLDESGSFVPEEASNSMQAWEDRSDAALVAATLGGESAAFGEIVRRYESAVAATVIGMMGPGDEAEEVGQLTMVKLYQSLDRFKGDAQLKTYVTRIAMNSALDALRRRKRNLLRFIEPPSNDQEAWEDKIPSGEDHAEAFENRQLVQYALSRLKPEFRSVAVLRLMHGNSVDEVAEILGVAQGTVLSRLSRAKKQLTDILRKELNHG